MTNENHDIAFDIKRRGCAKELFVSTVKGRKLVREIRITVSFASHVLAEHSKDPNQTVEFGLKSARLKLDLGGFAEINLKEPFLSMELTLASSAKIYSETEEKHSHQDSSELSGALGLKPQASGKISATDHKAGGDKSSVEHTLTDSHIDCDFTNKQKPEWHFRAVKSRCLTGPLPDKHLCVVNMLKPDPDFFVLSSFDFKPKDVILHDVPEDFYAGLDDLDTALKRRSLQVLISQKICDESCTERELHRLLDRGDTA